MVFRSSYILDMLGLPDIFTEKDLESAIITQIESFIKELGSDFTFVARQKRITVDAVDWVGGGAGMAPLRAQIMHMLKTLNTRDREMHYFYGARAIDEVFFLDDFLAMEKEYPNFHFHLALDRPDPKADGLGIKYMAGFSAPVMGDTYLKQHEEPEDIEYYLCGPPMMAKTVLDLLHSLGVEDDMIHFDNFGG